MSCQMSENCPGRSDEILSVTEPPLKQRLYSQCPKGRSNRDNNTQNKTRNIIMYKKVIRRKKEIKQMDGPRNESPNARA